MKGGTAALPYLYAENLQADILNIYVYVYTCIFRKFSVIMFAFGFQNFS